MRPRDARGRFVRRFAPVEGLLRAARGEMAWFMVGHWPANCDDPLPGLLPVSGAA
jgi:hypothetical protein